MNQLEQYLDGNPTTLTQGRHVNPECGACILEVCSQALHMEWTDAPMLLDLPDMRPLNDAAWPSDEMRTQYLTRVAVAVWPWRDATADQRRKFARRLAELTIKRVLPPVLLAAGLKAEAERCKAEGTEDAARAASYPANAARAAHAARAAYAANAAYAAAHAAYAAAPPAAAAAAAAADAAADAADEVEALTTACDCWVEAAEHAFGGAQ